MYKAWKMKHPEFNAQMRGRYVRACKGKAAYFSPADVLNDLRDFEANLRDEKRPFFGWYRCKLCRKIHVGNSKKKDQKHLIADLRACAPKETK